MTRGTKRRVSLLGPSNPPVFLRWAGGKRWLLPRLVEIFKGYSFNSYIEPFLGGGSVFLGWGHSVAKQFVLSDIESTLIETYETLRQNPEKVVRHLARWKPNKTTYLALRAQSTNGHTEKNAARFIFLNRLCWNGLYRVNRDGEFNVPYSPKQIPPNLGPTIRSAAELLASKDVGIKNGHFAKQIKAAQKGDIVFVDPPYVLKAVGTPPHRCYNVDQFTWDDQVSLAKECVAAVKRGVVVVATPGRGAHALYPSSLFKKEAVFRHRIIAADADKRTKYRENLLISKRWKKNARRLDQEKTNALRGE